MIVLQKIESYHLDIQDWIWPPRNISDDRFDKLSVNRIPRSIKIRLCNFIKQNKNLYLHHLVYLPSDNRHKENIYTLREIPPSFSPSFIIGHSSRYLTSHNNIFKPSFLQY